ncbi:hypothetical protein Krac_3701 [Ktedonobacter racemifer DSM 44963]|uniref:Uncharacterized protein n=1 Tax=Ktedonobacter racemifer DSM 44963 TaxID=485913 RepID=D6U2T8_KTERA|nr:hypothetical protein Krac_3701 [Ktedonobacter racemifer DSM 44963]
MKQQQRTMWESYARIRFPTFIGAETRERGPFICVDCGLIAFSVCLLALKCHFDEATGLRATLRWFLLIHFCQIMC